MPKLRSPMLLILAAVAATPAPVAAQTAATATLAKAVPTKIVGREALGQSFSYEMDVTVAVALAFDDVVNQPLTMTLAPGFTVSGIVDSFEEIGASGASITYRLRLVPKSARLAHQIRSRTFAEVSVPSAIRTVLTQGGLAEGTDFELRTNGNYPVRQLITQYRESDLAFVSRLLEQHGLTYFFLVDGRMVITDYNGNFETSAVASLPVSTTVAPAITSLQRGQLLHAGRVDAGDYRWQTAATVAGSSSGARFTAITEVHYPLGGETASAAVATERARIRENARQAAAQICKGTTSYANLRPGHKIAFTGTARYDAEYIITSIEHSGSPSSFKKSFTCLPSSIAYAPPPTTPVPTIAGTVQGVVLGPAGETKWTDTYGRVKVKFLWRRSVDSNASAGDVGWIRVMQPPGGMLLPAVGQEVVIAFEFGDPDRPIVIGTQFNGAKLPPVSLPDNRNRAILTLQ